MMHVRPTIAPELAAFFGVKVAFGSDFDEIVLPAGAGDLRLVNADPYLNKIIVRDCEAFLAKRRINVGPFRVRVENAIAPLLPHGSARASVVAQALGMSERTHGTQARAGRVELYRDIATAPVGDGGSVRRGSFASDLAHCVAARLRGGQLLQQCLQAVDREVAPADAGRRSGSCLSVSVALRSPSISEDG